MENKFRKVLRATLELERVVRLLQQEDKALFASTILELQCMINQLNSTGVTQEDS